METVLTDVVWVVVDPAVHAPAAAPAQVLAVVGRRWGQSRKRSVARTSSSVSPYALGSCCVRGVGERHRRTRTGAVGANAGTVCKKKRTFSSISSPMCKPNATITVASRPFLYDFTVTRGSEPVPYRAFLHECCRYPNDAPPKHAASPSAARPNCARTSAPSLGISLKKDNP